MIRLSTPEGYFEESLNRTLASAAIIRKRRRTALCCCVAFVLLAGGALYALQSHYTKEYIAYQAEMAQIDIFLEVNQ